MHVRRVRVGSALFGTGSATGIGRVPFSTSAQPPRISVVGHPLIQDEPCTAEIIYLVIPKDAKPRQRRTRIQEFSDEFGRTLSAFSGALSLCLVAVVALYGLYTLKSMAGIDLFADKHLEDFVPIPGYHRW